MAISKVSMGKFELVHGLETPQGRDFGAGCLPQALGRCWYLGKVWCELAPVMG